MHATLIRQGTVMHLEITKRFAFQQKMFVTLGGTLRDAQPVTSIEPNAHHVTITTAEQSYRARSVVITAGPWTQKVVQPLGLKLPLKVSSCFSVDSTFCIDLYCIGSYSEPICLVSVCNFIRFIISSSNVLFECKVKLDHTLAGCLSADD